MKAKRKIFLTLLLLATSGCGGNKPPGCPDYSEFTGYSPARPARIWDDGQSTFALFLGNSPLPVPYFVDQVGHEALVESSVTVDGHDHLMTLHGTAQEVRFRKGGEVVCVVNDGWSPAGNNPGTGTTSPDVMRVLR